MKASVTETAEYTAASDSIVFNLLDPAKTTPTIDLLVFDKISVIDSLGLFGTVDDPSSTFTNNDLEYAVLSDNAFIDVVTDELGNEEDYLYFSAPGEVQLLISLPETNQTNAVSKLISFEVFPVFSIIGNVTDSVGRSSAITST